MCEGVNTRALKAGREAGARDSAGVLESGGQGSRLPHLLAVELKVLLGP